MAIKKNLPPVPGRGISYAGGRGGVSSGAGGARAKVKAAPPRVATPKAATGGSGGRTKPPRRTAVSGGSDGGAGRSGNGGNGGKRPPSNPPNWEGTSARNKAAESYKLSDPARSAAAKKAAQTRADNIEARAQVRERVAKRKGAVQGATLAGSGALAVGGVAGAASHKEKSKTPTVRRVPPQRRQEGTVPKRKSK